MKLEGSLDAFSLPDIFQLLSYTKKTGGLRLQHADAQGVVYFTDGAVTGATAEGGRQSLARRLVGMNLVDDDALTAAVMEVSSGKATAGVVSTLVAAGAVTADASSRVAFEQLHDAVFELLRWPSGDFQFAVDQVNPDDVGLRLTPDDVVARASEHQVRWNAAASVIPSPDVVPILLGSTESETEVRSADWPVLRLVDGHRKVSAIVELVGAGQLATVVTLADLVTRGLIEVRGADTTDPVEDLVRRMALLAPLETEAAPIAPAAPAQAEVAPEPAAVVAPKAAPAPKRAAPEPVAPAPEPEPVLAVEEAVAAPEPAPTVEPATPLAAVASAAPSTPSTVVTVAESDLPPTQAGNHDTLVVPRPRLGGAHTPGDVVPPRAEPFLAARRPEFAESQTPGLRPASAPPRSAGGAGGSVGNAAVAAAPDGLIERDPSVNRSLLLRLIAGVRGL